jgi:hypothetical protein
VTKNLAINVIFFRRLSIQITTQKELSELRAAFQMDRERLSKIEKWAALPWWRRFFHDTTQINALEAVLAPQNMSWWPAQ